MDLLRKLHDIEELKACKARYGKLVDECPIRGLEASTELAQLFTEDAVGDFSEVFGRVFHGRADIVQYFGEVLAKSRGWMVHYFSNPIIEVEGDNAKAYWALYAMSTSRENPNEEAKISYGRYHDEYVRTADGWKQSKLKIFNETRKWAAHDAPKRG